MVRTALGKSSSPSTGTDSQVEHEAEQLWAKFEEAFTNALQAMERIGDSDTPTPLSPGAYELFQAQGDVARQGVTGALSNFAVAGECLRSLGGLWPDKRVGLGKLRKAMAEYDKGMRIVNKMIAITESDLGFLGLMRAQLVVMRFRRHMSRGDELYLEGLSLLGKSSSARGLVP
jgi:hypothetical protein